MINGKTKTYGIIGHPVEHSLSPCFQNRFLQAQHSNALYIPFTVQPELLSDCVAGLWALGVEGFNVTVPHKESIFSMVAADADAQRIGAVNTVRRSGDHWQATNTDWRGFKAVVEGLQVDMAGQSALLFGAGGTSRAVLHALAQLHVGTVMICNRNQERLAALMQVAHEHYPDLHCEALAWQQESVSKACEHAALVINTTSIGLQAGQVFPFVLSGAGVAIDAVYQADGNTAFIHAAALAGRTGIDGLPMLIAQGAAAFAWWHDCAQPDMAHALQQMQCDLKRDVVALPGWENA